MSPTKLPKVKSLLECFPSSLTPRAVQSSVLSQLEKAWSSYDVFVVNLPVASGKSAIAVSIARWQGKTAILTPTNVLVKQYKDEYPALATLGKRDSYACWQTPTRSCEDTKLACGRTCAGNTCTWSKAIRKAHAFPFGVYNYHTYLAHKLRKEVLVIDEAHNLLPFLQELASQKLWRKDYHYPSNLNTYADLLKWVDELPAYKLDDKLKRIKADVENVNPQLLLHRTTGRWRDLEEEDVIEILPLTTRDEPPLLWPNKVKKIVLLSATIGRKDVESLGLDKKRVCYIEGDSPIPVERRPITFIPVADASLKHQEKSVPELARFVEEVLLPQFPEKGLIHATYGLAAELRTLLKSDRFIFHNRNDKSRKYQEFLDSRIEEGRILVASGLYEGIDLPYDAGRWQVLLKIPWPSLGEPAIRHKSESDPEWYAWETVKTVLQAVGRISRKEDDYGESLILDKSFGRLIERWPDLFPNYFKDALTFVGETI